MKSVKLAIAMLLVFAMIGCSDNSPKVEMLGQGIQVNDELSASQTPVSVAESALSQKNDGQMKMGDSGAIGISGNVKGVYYITLLWGAKIPNPDSPWKGNILTSHGRLDIVSTLGFGEGDSYSVPLNKNQIAWNTQASTTLKGITVRLDLSVAMAAGTSLETVAIIYQAGTYEIHMPMSEMPKALTSFLADSPDIFLVSGYAYEKGTCKEGMLSGYWQKLSNGANAMVGYWLSPEGNHLGTIEAIFYEGEEVSIITGGSSNVKGGMNYSLSGGYDENGNFAGAYKDAKGAGYFQGKFLDYASEANGGAFRGSWQSECQY